MVEDADNEGMLGSQGGDGLAQLTERHGGGEKV